MLNSTSKRETKAVFVLGVAGLLYFLPLALNNYPYIDDFGRIQSGTYLWDGAGRPLTNVVMAILNLGLPLTDLSPLPQLLATVIMLRCCFLLFRLIDVPFVPPVATAITSSIFLYQPFFLENMAYQFDSFPMAISALAATVAGTWYVPLSPWSFLTRALLVLSSLTLYQPALNIFFGISIIRICRNMYYDKKSRPFLDIATAFGVAAFSFIAYFAFLKYIAADAHTLGRSAMLPVNGYGIRTAILQNFQAIWVFIQAFNPIQIAILACYSVLTAAGWAWISLRTLSTRGFIPLNLVNFFFMVLSLAALLLLSYGFLCALTEQLVVPRQFVAAGLFLSIITSVPVILWSAATVGICCISHKRKQLIACIIAFVPLFICIVYAFAFASAQRAQMRFAEGIVSLVRSHIDNKDLQKPFVIKGTIPLDLVSSNEASKFPGIGRLVPRYFSDNWLWGYYVLRHFGVVAKMPDEHARTEAIASIGGQVPIYSEPSFRLYVTESSVVLDFQEVH